MEGKTRRPDRRVMKTKRAIKKAFIKLLLVKDYNKITIKDIATEADVDRKTVYNYYSGIYEIRDELENEILKSMEESIEKFDYTDPYSHTKKCFEALSTLINQNNELFGYLFKNEANSKMLRKIIFYFKDNVLKILKDSPIANLSNDKLELLASFISGGAMITYQNWFYSERKSSLTKLSEDLTAAAFAVVKSFVEKNPVK